MTRTRAKQAHAREGVSQMACGVHADLDLAAARAERSDLLGQRGCQVHRLDDRDSVSGIPPPILGGIYRGPPAGVHAR